jgi:hypothetical protein
MAERFCPKCGRKANEETVFCSGCGTRIPDPEPEARSCPKCGAALDDISPFCWKCGAAVAATPAGFRREMRRRDGLDFDPVRKPRGTTRWPILVIVLLVALVVVFAVLWITPYGSEVLGRQTVYISGVNDTLTISGPGGATESASALVGCSDGCPLSEKPGESFSLVWVSTNVYENATMTLTTIVLTGGWVGSVSPAAPVTIPAGGTQVFTLTVTAPMAPGSYFVPLTIDAAVS